MTGGLEGQPGSELHPLDPQPLDIGRQAVWNYAAFIGAAITNLLLTGIAARGLDKEVFGTYVFILALTMLVPLLDFGMRAPVTVAAAQADGQHPNTAESRAVFLAGHSFYLLLGLSAAAVVLLTCGFFVLATGTDPAVILTGAMTGLAAALNIGTAALIALATAHMQFKRMALWMLLGHVLNLVLTLSLLPSLGITALGVGYLTSSVVGRLPITRWARRTTSWLKGGWSRPSRTAVLRLVAIAAPSFALSISAQVVTTTDVFILAAVIGPSAVASYRIGSALPTQSVGLLYRGVDVIFPALAKTVDRAAQEALVWKTTLLSSALAGIGMCLLILLRYEAVWLMSGSADPLAETILVLFGLAWLANVPTHAIALLLISRHRQSVLVPLVGAEAALNLLLTLLLVRQFGAVGAAVATLSTMIISNLVILPVVVRSEVRRSCIQSVWMLGVAPIVWALVPAMLLARSLDGLPVGSRLALSCLSVAGWACLGGGASYAYARRRRVGSEP